MNKLPLFIAQLFLALLIVILSDAAFAETTCQGEDEDGNCVNYLVTAPRLSNPDEGEGGLTAGGRLPSGGGGGQSATSNSGSGNVKDLCRFGRDLSAMARSTGVLDEERVLAARDVQAYLLPVGYRGTFLVTYADGGRERFTATMLTTPAPVPGTLVIGNQPVTGCT